jgi:hypothetical protein
MKICPIAIAVGCQKCPAFKICPLKSALGDAPKADPAPTAVKPLKSARPAKKSPAARKRQKK